MPNYQLPEIPGGVVWVRVSEILQENLDAIKLAKDRGYDEDEIFEGQHTKYDAVIETYEDLLAILKPIPVTPVKEEQNNSKAPDGWRDRFYDNFIKNDSMDGLMFRSSIQPYHIEKFIESLLASKDQEIERLKSELEKYEPSEDDKYYESIYMKVVEMIEKDNIQCEAYLETAKKLQKLFIIKSKENGHQG